MKPEDEDKTDNICNGVYWVDGGVLQSSLYWIDSLATYPKKPKEIADKKFVEQEHPKMGHVHADNMLKFAQDAQKTKMWQWILRDKTDGTVSLTEQFLPSIPPGNEEYEYFEVLGKAHWTEIEV